MFPQGLGKEAVVTTRVFQLRIGVKHDISIGKLVLIFFNHMLGYAYIPTRTSLKLNCHDDKNKIKKRQERLKGIRCLASIIL